MISTLEKMIKISLRIDRTGKKLPLRIKITCPTTKKRVPTPAGLAITLWWLLPTTSPSGQQGSAGANREIVSANNLTVGSNAFVLYRCSEG